MKKPKCPICKSFMNKTKDPLGKSLFGKWVCKNMEWSFYWGAWQHK